MDVKILKIAGNNLVDAKISDSKIIKANLPSMTDGWRFNFRNHSKGNGFETYVLVCEETPDKIEGCLIFEMKKKVEPYMAFVEVAPHNKGKNKEYENVAGCLIAFACRLSFKNGKGDYLGYLAFDVMEEDKADEIKLMALYSTKYNAFRYGETTMIIPPEGGQKLIDEFLN
ncbi:hypothetical protein D0817_24765 [Flavobacterium cupreum]|uniref:N-acetyltransferase n=2 Tax=Flavobacterium TaxID=237 RepID=A0A4Y7U5S6_9FLAO|nr:MULTISPECIES: hypothetical protein [Flavobacterium]RUT67746.1 hypothetical protein D0817_24765 [Flavobacterium cupreum]TCN50536.1 hypothetical protein EV142_11513 [Flavobacterium circumlabens]TEB41787.1 hypothetical protein D0809_23625 [Flavobacterium circumlabens]